MNTPFTPPESAGTTAVIGGAFDSPRIFETMLAAASRGTRPRIAVVLSSKNGSHAARKAYFRDKLEKDAVIDPSMRRWFSDHGFEPVYIPLTIDNFASVAHDRRLAEQIASCDAVYLAGGDQAKHVRCLLEPDGRDTPVLRAIRSVAQKGGLVSGSSAGAAAQGGLQYGEGEVYRYLVENRLIERRIEDGTLHNDGAPGVGSLQQGLGLLRDDVLVCTHFDQRYRLGRLLVGMRAAELKSGAPVLGIGVDEDTGLFVRGSEGRVAGTHGVFLADASEAVYGPGPSFEVGGVRLTYLTHGDRFDLDRKIASTDKPLSPSRGAPEVTCEDILAPNRMTELIERMIRSGADRAIGYTKQSDPRFRFELVRDARTRAYDGEAVSVSELLLRVVAESPDSEMVRSD